MLTFVPEGFSAASGYGENLVSNSSFESSSEWGFTGNLYRSNDKANSGSYSLKCNARGQAVCVCSTATINVKKNTDYLLSGYVYRSDNSAWAYIDMNDRTGEVQLLDTTTYGKWQYVSAVWNSGDATTLQVRIVVEPNYTINQHMKEGITGDIWFDDISFKEVLYDEYDETPPTISKNATSYVLENEDIKVTVATDNNKEYLTSLVNKENSYNWINKATKVELLSEYKAGELSWVLSDTYYDNDSKLLNTGKDSYRSLVNTYYCDINGLVLKSYWQIYKKGPIYHYSEIINNTGKTISFDPTDVVASDVLFKLPDNVTVHSFNRSRFNNGFDGNFTSGVFENKVTTNMFFKSTVENSWLKNSGSLPFEILQSGDNHGLYIGYEHSYGDMLIRTQNDKNILRFTATLTESQNEITRDNKDVLRVPPVFYGAYCGDVDDGSNNMKSWFYNHLMTESLRENENEPPIELHIPVFSESALKDYLSKNNLEQYGVELTKMDYWWTVPGDSFDEKLEQQWNPDKGKWPNSMTYGKLVKSYYPSVKTSLYMADTYNGVDIGTKAGRQAQIDALSQRMKDWRIDYWRSDFDVLKPNDYANHEGLMYILDTLSDGNPDFRYEHCSAGGSLKDFATLQRMTFMTMEDSGGALNHRMAFYSNSYMINPVQLKFDLGFDWTSDADSGYINSNRDKWNVYSVRTAMMGAMMVQNVGSYLSESEKQALIDGWSLYKTKQRPILKGADVYHILPMPDGKNWDGMMFYNHDIEKGSVFLFRDKNIGSVDGSSKNIKLKGLDENALYKLTFEDRTSQNTRKSGKELMYQGITVSGLDSVYDSEIIWIEKIEKEKYLVGDVNNDGNVSVIDATIIQRYVAKSESLSEKAELCADTDLNGEVTVTDATYIQRYCAHLSSAYCGEYKEVEYEIPDIPTEPDTEKVPVDNRNMILFKNTPNWNTVYAYYWSDNNTSFVSWPGVPSEMIADDIYAVEVPVDATKIIFNNGGNGGQTSDLVIEGKWKVYVDGVWYDY